MEEYDPRGIGCTHWTEWNRSIAANFLLYAHFICQPRSTVSYIYVYHPSLVITIQFDHTTIVCTLFFGIGDSLFHMWSKKIVVTNIIFWYLFVLEYLTRKVVVWENFVSFQCALLFLLFFIFTYLMRFFFSAMWKSPPTILSSVAVIIYVLLSTFMSLLIIPIHHFI